MKTGDISSTTKRRSASIEVDLRFQYLLKDILKFLPTDIACIYTQPPHHQPQTLILAHDGLDILPHQDYDDLIKWIANDIQTLSAEAIRFIPCNIAGFQSCFTIPFRISMEVIGALSLFSRIPIEYTTDQLEQIETPLSIIQTILESDNLTARLLNTEPTYIQQGRAAILEAVTDGVVLILPNQDATILTYNKQFIRTFSLKERSQRANLQGTSWWEFLEKTRIPKTTIDEMQAGWQLRQDLPDNHIGKTIRGEYKFPDSKGNEHDIQWYSAPVYVDERLLGYIYTFHDVTPERMGERLRADLISRVSHELRTPLTAISGFAEFILEITEDELPDIAREYTEIILDSARHLNSVFTDMIEFSRANSGGIELYFNLAQVQDVIIEVVARLELHYKSRQQRVIMDLDDDTPPTLMDIDRVNQIVTNLLVNAIKYAPENSEIRIILRQVYTHDDLPLSVPKDIQLPVVLVSVFDEGMGVEEEELENIFLPFYRAPNADAQYIEGAGLGLAIAQSLVELHNGKIWAEATTKTVSGGRFFFTLPLIIDTN